MGGATHYPTECTGHIPYLVLVWCLREWISLQIITHLLHLIILTRSYQTVPAGEVRRERGRVNEAEGRGEREREREEGKGRVSGKEVEGRRVRGKEGRRGEGE